MSDSIKSADRRLKLLLMLQSSKQLSVNKIADYFGVSRRTVFRDLRALQDMEVPIMHDSVEGYSLMKGYKVPPLMFTERELASIVLGLSFMKGQTDESMRSDADQVLLKIKNVIPSNLLTFIQSIEENVISSPYYSDLNSYSQLGDWFSICSAISERSRIEFEYIDAQGEKTQRQIDPYFIVLYQDHWNVIGYDYSRNDRRNFKLESISNTNLLPNRFTSITNEQKKRLIYNLKAENQTTHTLSVKSENINSFLKVFPALILKKEVINDKIKLSFSFDNIEFIASFLVAHLNYISIDSDDLKKEIKAQLQKRISSLD
jgi:predicted DNA-binding transcriptional regulator YafY